jgi:predicted MFS family arabinose efflux permease
MVERFGFSASSITLMFLANHMVNMFLAPKIGKLIQHWGERRTLLLEYAGLIFVFSAYAFVQVAWVAVALFIVDHIFFTMAIAIKTYFQKIADPADMANTAGVSSAINHVAAVGLPMVLGLIWMVSPSYVFLIGTGIAAMSFCASILIPTDPAPGNEIVRPKLGWA